MFFFNKNDGYEFYSKLGKVNYFYIPVLIEQSTALNFATQYVMSRFRTDNEEFYAVNSVKFFLVYKTGEAEGTWEHSIKTLRFHYNTSIVYFSSNFGGIT